MLSSLITEYVTTGRDLVAMLRAHAQTVTQKMQEKLGSYCQQGETVPDAGFVLELEARRIEALIKVLIAADEAHNEELSDDADPRRRRDEAVDQLRAHLISVKQALITLFGSESLVTFKIPNEIPYDSASVERVSKDVNSALEMKPLPAAKLEGVAKVDVTPWTSKLTTQLHNLETAAKDVTREVREAQVTLVAKNRAIAAFEGGFREGASAGWGLLVAAGENEHAERLSINPRKASQSRTSSETQGGGQDDGSKGGGSGEGTSTPA